MRTRQSDHEAENTSRDLDHARHILEARTPAVLARVARDSGWPESVVADVLDAARQMHTDWPAANSEPPA